MILPLQVKAAGTASVTPDVQKRRNTLPWL